MATRHASRLQGTDLPVPHAARLHTDFHSRAGLPSCVTPSLEQPLPVPDSQPDVHLLRLLPRIRPRLTLDDDRCPGILMLSVGRILTALFATHANILTSYPSTVPYSTASAR